MRENENGQFLFILNHNETPEMITLDVGGMDLITKKAYRSGEVLTMQKKDILILKCGEKEGIFSSGEKKLVLTEAPEKEEEEPIERPIERPIKKEDVETEATKSEPKKSFFN
jgi:hypothetical protein